MLREDQRWRESLASGAGVRRPSRSRAAVILPLLLSAIVLLTMLSKRDFVTSHEARVGQTARQMAAAGWPWDARRVTVPVSGLLQTSTGKRLLPLPGRGVMQVNPWLVPVLNGRIRLQKPPLPYWCAAMTFRIFGVREAAARLPGALLGVLGTLLIFDLARHLLGGRAALPAALVWASSHFIGDEFRKAMADPYLTFFTLAAIWAWIRSREATPRRAFGILFYVAIALGAVSKGPVIFATVLPAIVAFHVLLRRRVPGDLLSHMIGIALLLAIALPWPVYALRHVPNALELWRYESIGEFGENAEKARPWWLYFPLSLEAALPWTPLWLCGLALPVFRGRVRLSPRNRRRLVLIAWFAIVLLIFSLAHVKKKAYLLPAAPAQTLLVAETITLLLAWARRTRFGDVPGVATTTQAAIGIGAAATFLVMAFRVSVDRVPGTILAACAVVAAIAALVAIFRQRPIRWLVLQPLSYAVALLVLLAFVQPDIDNRRSAKPFAPQVMAVIQQTGLPLSTTNLPEEASFYLPLDVPIATDNSPRMLVIVDDGRLAIDRGKLVPDARFFSPLLDGANVIDATRVPTPQSPPRWKLYEVSIDREHA